ncbi:MAG: sulfatase-like hydrolase/transferase [Pyrinomonadaceae bacterium]|nr:sulfatase-like hydrolase/transferase [Pyrinomonadaceae bacterium]
MPRHWILAFSLSNLCFFNAWREVLSPQGLSYLYYWKQYPGYVALAALVINVLLLALIFLTGFYLLRRLGGSNWVKFGQALFLLVFLRALNNIQAQFDSLSTSHLRLLLGRAGYIVAVFLVLSLIAFAIKRYGLDRVARAAAMIVLILSPFGVLGLTQASWLAVKYGRSVSRERTATTAFNPSTSPRPRVLWLVFDEMDEHLAFSGRPAGLSLPEFDRVRAEALVATNAFPPAGHTSQSIPALLTGQLISAVKPIDPGELLVTIAARNETVNWSTEPDTFSDARAAGLNTALVGWYNPYCRVIGDHLTSCRWEAATQRIDPTKLSLKKNLIRQNSDLLRLLPFTARIRARLLPAETRDYRSEFLADYLTLMRQAEDAVANQEFGLLFIHLPVPHPPYIYDRAKGDLTVTQEGSYLDSLALADRALGDLRQKMEQAGTWDSTSVVISSDHWWRSDYWRKHFFWTASDQMVQGERVEHRVPFMIKLAGQKTTLPYNPPFNTVLTRSLIREVLNGNISEPGQVAAWLDTHRTIGESPYQDYEDAE